MSDDLFDKLNPKPVALFVSDVHWRLDKPEYRKEVGPFVDVIGMKLLELFEYANKHSKYNTESLPIFFAGDLFNGARDFMQMWTLNGLIDTWNRTHQKQLVLYSVRGQHDMKHHNQSDNATSFNALLRNGVIEVLSGEKSVYLTINENRPLAVTGCGWGETPLQCGSANNVLVMHKTLWHKEPVFPGQTEGNISVEAIRLKELGYDMVFSGDNHKSFDVIVGGVEFHNVGAFTRNSVDLADQQPRFCVLRSDMSVESILVGEKDVFDITRSDGDKEHANAKDEFSEALAGGFSRGDTFEGALEGVIASGRCGDLELTTKQLDVLRDILGAI